MSVVFADAFYFIALSNPADGHHAAAVRATESLSSRLVATHYVLIEVADALSAPRFRAEVSQFLQQLALDPGTEIIGPDISLYELRTRALCPAARQSLVPHRLHLFRRDDRTRLDGSPHRRQSLRQAGFRALLR